MPDPAGEVMGGGVGGGGWALVGWGRAMFSDGPAYAAAHAGKPRQSTSGQGIGERSPAAVEEEK